jgi:hypothetical protein
MLQKTKVQGSTLLIHSVQHPVKGLKFVFSFLAHVFKSKAEWQTIFTQIGQVMQHF